MDPDSSSSDYLPGSFARRSRTRRFRAMTLRPTSSTRGRISTGTRTTTPFRTLGATRSPSCRFAARSVSWSRVTDRLLPCLRIFTGSTCMPPTSEMTVYTAMTMLGQIANAGRLTSGLVDPAAARLARSAAAMRTASCSAALSSTLTATTRRRWPERCLRCLATSVSDVFGHAKGEVARYTLARCN